MGISGGQCVECGREVGLYNPSACGDDGGQSWCIAHLPVDHPQASLKLRLIDGRPRTIDSVHIEESSTGFIIARPEVIWSAAFQRDDRNMPGAWGELPTFVIRRSRSAATSWYCRDGRCMSDYSASRSSRPPDRWAAAPS